MTTSNLDKNCVDIVRVFLESESPKSTNTMTDEQADQLLQSMSPNDLSVLYSRMSQHDAQTRSVTMNFEEDQDDTKGTATTKRRVCRYRLMAMRRNRDTITGTTSV